VFVKQGKFYLWSNHQSQMLFKVVKAVNRSLLVQHLTKPGTAMLRTRAGGVKCLVQNI